MSSMNRCFLPLIVALLSLVLWTPGLGQIKVDKVPALGTKVANYMDQVRLVPDSLGVPSGGFLKARGVIELFARGITVLADGNSDSLLIPLFTIDTAFNVAPSIVLDSTVMGWGMEKETYLELCDSIIHIAHRNSGWPLSIQLSKGHIRFIEALYVLAGILRHHDFFGFLPESFEPLVFPSGQVAWEAQGDLRRHLAALSGWLPYHYQEYYFYGVGKYPVFRIAQQYVVGDSGSTATSRRIYTSVIDRWMKDAGYKLWVPTFGLPSSAYDWWKFNLANSAFQFFKMQMLNRSLGIPATEERVYDMNGKAWVNTDVHKGFGDTPYELLGTEMNTWDHLAEPNPSDKFIVRIRGLMTESGASAPQESFLWVNPMDVSKYGAEEVVARVKRGGFHSIIITVKNEEGWIYYPYTSVGIADSIDLSPDQHYTKRYVYDVLSTLLPVAAGEGIRVYGAISIMADWFSLTWSQMHWSETSPQDRWQQYIQTPSGKQSNSMSICPCSADARDLQIRYARDLASIPGLSGIVLAHLYWDDMNYVYQPDANPACDSLRSRDHWQSYLLRSFTRDLTRAVKMQNDSLTVLLAGYSGSFEYYPNFRGMEDPVGLDSLVDGYILPYSGFHWLRDSLEYAHPQNTSLFPQSPSPFSLEKRIAVIRNGFKGPVYVSFPIIDEWEYSPVFYSGLWGHLSKLGVSGMGLHNFNSLGGRWGEAFSPTQLQKVSEIDFMRTYSSGSLTNVVEESNAPPTGFLLAQNYPNPFNPTTTIRYGLPSRAKVTLTVFNTLGQQVSVLQNGEQNAGYHELRFDGVNLPSGVYFYRLQAGTFVETKRLLLLR